MNQMLTTVGAVAAVAKVASTAYHYAEHLGVFSREAKVEAETRSVEVAENQSADVGIPLFNGIGYDIWSSMMRSLFLSQDLWDMVNGGYIEEELTVEVLREVQKKDAMALLFIQQAIDKSVFSCIVGASNSKEAWDALQKKYQGDAQELNPQNSVDESSVLSCPADATECREAWDALEMESRGYTADEPNQKKAVDELVLSYAADPQLGHKANTKVVEANRIGKESGDIKNNNCGSKKVSKGISSRGGRNCGRFNNNQGGRDGECSNNLVSHGGTGHNGDFNNSQGGRGGQGCGHINNNRGGRGGKGRGHIDNKRGGHRGHSNNNQGDCRGTGSGCSKNQGGRGHGHGGLDDGCFNSNKGHSGGIDNGHFNKGSEAAADYNSKNAKSESASSCTTNAAETKEALDAHALQQGHQANTEVLNLMAQVCAQPQAGNPNGGVSQSLTTLLVGNLDVNVTDLQLFGIFIHFGQVVSSGVCRDMATQCSLGYGYVTYGNPQDADRALKELNFTQLNGKPIQIMYFQQDSTEHESGGFNTKKSDYGGIDGARFNNNQGGCVGADSGCFNNKDSKLSCYNSKNPKFESVSSCSTNATESREASDAPQQGHQANTEVKAQLQVGNPSGGSILIKNLDNAIGDRGLHAIFSAFGNILCCKVETDASGQSKGYGHIDYDSEEAAQEAIEKVNGMLLNHKKVYVGPFVSKQERGKTREMTKSTNVYVGNLSESTTEEDLRDVFGYFGTLVSIVVMRDGDGKSKCLGFVNFKDADDASWSIEVLNGHKFDNKEWCVRRASQKKRARRAKKKSVDESVPSSTANASESKKAGDAVSEKKFIGKPQKKSVDESVPSSTANASKSKKAGNAVSEKKITGKPQKKSVGESAPSSTAKATESKQSGDAVSQKKFKGRVQKKSADKSVPSSTANETESKKAVEAVQKGYRANTRVL